MSRHNEKTSLIKAQNDVNEVVGIMRDNVEKVRLSFKDKFGIATLARAGYDCFNEAPRMAASNVFGVSDVGRYYHRGCALLSSPCCLRGLGESFRVSF